MLILDEPTNHLDEQATSFLVHTLKNWPGPVLATSHDRAFIEESATVIYDLDRNVWSSSWLGLRAKVELVGLVRNAGNYSAYLEAKLLPKLNAPASMLISRPKSAGCASIGRKACISLRVGYV